MTNAGTIEERISLWLEEDSERQFPDRLLQASYEQTRRSRQQRDWRGFLAGLSMPRSVPALGSAVVLVVAATLALNVLANRQAGIGVPPSPRLQTPASTPSEQPSVDLGVFESVAGRIVYQQETGIWGVDPASSDPATMVQLTSRADDPLGWSSDGTRLLVKGDENLSVLHADGSETQVVERLLGFHGATISPDGSRVVFAGQTGTPEGEFCANGALFAVDAAGGPAEVLWRSREGIVREPTFSPDGTRIAFADGFCDHRHSVWVMNADGSDAHQIVSNDIDRAGHVYGLAWSPAGDRIALAFEGAIYTFATDSSGFTQIAGGDSSCESPQSCAVDLKATATAPHWSPDGSRIAYTTGCIDGVQMENTEGCDLAVADADGSNVRKFSYGLSGPWHPGRLPPSLEPTAAPSPSEPEAPSTEPGRPRSSRPPRGLVGLVCVVSGAAEDSASAGE